MATPKKEASSAAKTAAPKVDNGTAALRKELADVKEAVRRLASGAVVTEEQRDDLFELLGSK